jgi:NAD(P)-dependent dehydrogenase (short-subunit alcohol dehydrogenase family)
MNAKATQPAAGVIRDTIDEIRRTARRRRFEYRGKVFVITGGAGGIGSALAAHVAARGSQVVIVDLNERSAKRVAQSLPRGDSTITHTALPADLTDLDEIERVLKAITAAYGRIDVLVNNAGMTSSERFENRSPESIRNEILVNTISPLWITRLALPLLRQAADPRVISTVSLAGIWPQAETPIYCASKFGLRGAMNSIAMDFHGQGIKVGSVLPSATDTPLLRQEAIDGGNALQFQDPPQTPADVVAAFASILDRPRLEAYPKPRESYLVRAAMLFPNMLFILLPFFEGKGQRGMQEYIDILAARGDIVKVNGRWQLAES